MRKIRLLIARYEDPDWVLIAHKRVIASCQMELRDKLERLLPRRAGGPNANKLAAMLWSSGYATAQQGEIAVYGHRAVSQTLPVPVNTSAVRAPSKTFLPYFKLPRFSLSHTALASTLTLAVLLAAMMLSPSRDLNQLAAEACPESRPDYAAYVDNAMTAEEWSAAQVANWADKTKFGRTHYRNHGAHEGRQMWCVHDV